MPSISDIVHVLEHKNQVLLWNTWNQLKRWRRQLHFFLLKNDDRTFLMSCMCYLYNDKFKFSLSGSKTCCRVNLLKKLTAHSPVHCPSYSGSQAFASATESAESLGLSCCELNSSRNHNTVVTWDIGEKMNSWKQYITYNIKNMKTLYYW